MRLLPSHTKVLGDLQSPAMATSRLYTAVPQIDHSLITIRRKPVGSEQRDLSQTDEYAPLNSHEHTPSARSSGAASEYEHASHVEQYPTAIETLDSASIVDNTLLQSRHRYMQAEQHEHSSPSCESATKASTITNRDQRTWLPYTLRWPYLFTIVLTSLLLSALVAGLTWSSTVHTGICDNTDSMSLLFAWRFLPTLAAVVYVLMQTMLLVDLRRTEVFAKLNRNSASRADTTILRSPGSWWNDPSEALKKQNGESVRSWSFFWCAITNIVGMFVISPLSSGLLSVDDLQISTSTTFNRIAAFQNDQLFASADDSTFVRTISSATLGLRTSAWLQDEYAILPFWPSDTKTVPLGASLAPTPQIWTGATTVFQVVLECEPIWLSRAAYEPGRMIYPPPYTLGRVSQGPAYSLLYLTSNDGCNYGLGQSAPSWSTNTDIFEYGGGWWSNTTTHDSSVSEVKSTYNYGDTLLFVGNSAECNGRDIFFITTPFSNRSTRAAGHVCSTHYYQADVECTVTTSTSGSDVAFDEERFHGIKDQMPASFDRKSFESLFYSDQWTSKFQPPTSPVLRPKPSIGGALLPIAALHNWNLNEMMTSSTILPEAKVIKQRFFGEALQKTFTSIGKHNATTILGTVKTFKSRVVVDLAIGATLAILLSLSACSLSAVWFFSRPSRRSLGLSHDPASVAAITSLISNEHTRSYFSGTDRMTKDEMSTALRHRLFRMTEGRLYCTSGSGLSTVQSREQESKVLLDRSM
jgi:hypothetical protein